MRAPFGRSRNHGVRAAARLLQVHAPVRPLIARRLGGSARPADATAAALSQGSPLPPPLPAPVRVALSGSFQSALGCPADFDPSCPQTQLQDNRDGSWSTILPCRRRLYLPRGGLQRRERATARAATRTAPISRSAFQGDAAGVYFRYDTLTGEIVAEPVANAATLVTDLGEQFAMAPAGGGGYEVTWDAQPEATGSRSSSMASPSPRTA